MPHWPSRKNHKRKALAQSRKFLYADVIVRTPYTTSSVPMIHECCAWTTEHHRYPQFAFPCFQPRSDRSIRTHNRFHAYFPNRTLRMSSHCLNRTQESMFVAYLDSRCVWSQDPDASSVRAHSDVFQHSSDECRVPCLRRWENSIVTFSPRNPPHLTQTGCKASHRVHDDRTPAPCALRLRPPRDRNTQRHECSLTRQVIARVYHGSRRHVHLSTSRRPECTNSSHAPMRAASWTSQSCNSISIMSILHSSSFAIRSRRPQWCWVRDVFSELGGWCELVILIVFHFSVRCLGTKRIRHRFKHRIEMILRWSRTRYRSYDSDE